MRLRRRRRDRFEDHREAARVLERERVVEEPHRLGGRAALGLEAAQHRDALGRQAEVAHDGDAGLRQGSRAVDRRAGPLELDAVRAGLLDQPDAALDGLLVGHLVRAEGQVAQEEGVLRARRAARVSITISSIVTGVVPS